jgi:hypothetical protein
MREDDLVSKTVAVEFRGRLFWAFDVSLPILLHETVVIGARTTDGGVARPGAGRRATGGDPWIDRRA